MNTIFRHLTLFVVASGLAALSCNSDGDYPEPADLDSEPGTGDTETNSTKDSVSETDPDSADPEDTESDGTDDPDTDLPGPAVSLLFPQAPPKGDYGSDVIITTDWIEASCRVVEADNGDPVDRDSVYFTVRTKDDEWTTPAVPGSSADLFSAQLSFTGLPTSAVTVTCTAQDRSPSARQGSDEIVTFVDNGPMIEILSPADGAFYGTEVELAFRVHPMFVAPDDEAGQIDPASVSARLSGVDLAPILSAPEPGQNTYRALIRFKDPMFNPSIDGAHSIVISAANNRLPDPRIATGQVRFNADSSGPLIEILAPKPGELLRSIFDVAAKIQDPVGIRQDSVVATIGGLFDVPLSAVGDDLYAGVFDSRRLPPSFVFPNISVRARDNLGNQSAAGIVVSLDNAPPLLSLDPPHIREYYYDYASARIECSWLFDPLGGYDPAAIDPLAGDSADDGQSVPQLFEVRARVVDLGNVAPSFSGVDIPIAGVHSDSVQLFIFDDESGALLVDMNGDGYCDDINPLLMPDAATPPHAKATVVNLASLSKSGSADYRPLPQPPTAAQPSFDTSPDAPESACFQGSMEKPPSPICSTSPGTRIISGIYSVAPATSTQCYGNPLDTLAMSMNDGWACLAVRAVDAVGNVGISAPLRLCFNSDGSAAACGPWGTIETDNLPDCTGTFHADTGIVDPHRNCVLREADLSVPPDAPRSRFFQDHPSLQLIPR